MPNTSASNAKILVIGHTDLGRRVCLLLRERQVPVIHLAAASDAELREALTAGVTGVAVLLHDDIRALRYSLAIEHLAPGIRLFVAMFRRTARTQLEAAVPNCVVMSPAAIAVPSMVAAAVAPQFVAVRRRTHSTIRAWVSATPGEHAYALRAFAMPLHLRLQGALGVLRGQTRPYDRGSTVLMLGAVGLAAITAIDTYVGMGHDSFLVALYDAMLTTATITTPDIGHEPARLLWATVAAFLVMGFTAAFGAGIVHHLLEGGHVGLLGRRVIPRSGHVIVAGMGQVGLRLAQELRALRIAVVCIERNREAPTVAMAKALGIPVIIDSAASQGVLERAGVRRALAVVAAGSDERDNIAIALAARAAAAHINVVLRAGSDSAIDETRSLFHIGAAVDVNALTAAFVTQALTGRRPYLVLHERQDVVAIDDEGSVHSRYAAQASRCGC